MFKIILPETCHCFCSTRHKHTQNIRRLRLVIVRPARFDAAPVVSRVRLCTSLTSTRKHSLQFAFVFAEVSKNGHPQSNAHFSPCSNVTHLPCFKSLLFPIKTIGIFFPSCAFCTMLRSSAARANESRSVMLYIIRNPSPPATHSSNFKVSLESVTDNE